MSDPERRTEAEFLSALPEELQALDGELAGIRIEERPSFGPELEGELLAAWRAQGGVETRRTAPWARLVMAACLGGLMVAGVAVPSARASVVRLVRTVLEEAVPSLFAPPPQVRPTQGVEGVEPPASEVPPSSSVSADGDREEVPDPGPEAFFPVAYTFPEILFPEEARRIVSEYYPLGLQKAGIGGSVKVWFWVRPDGIPESVQMREGSGYRSLNYAAMRAVRDLRFRPATRGGTPVGTWVEFTVQFVPTETGGILELEPVGSGGLGDF